MNKVTYRKKTIVINMKLLEKQKGNLELIKRLHKTRLYIEHQMSKKSITTEDLLVLRDLWTVIQYELQDAWNFERSAKFHKFWTVPRCSCPKMDNDDSYGSGQSFVSSDCILHGVKRDL